MMCLVSGKLILKDVEKISKTHGVNLEYSW